jgi:ATP-dependent RNA helicase SUPV3L1/SUV3
LQEIFGQLSSARGRLDPDWMRQRIRQLDDVDGDIDTLMNRIAFVRTWTYISHHADWVVDAEYWREHTRAIEDRMSDALHQRLLARFVVRRRARAARPVRIDGEHPFSKLGELLHELREPSAEDAWVEALVQAGHDQIHADEHGVIWFRDAKVARITCGTDLLLPEVVLLRTDLGAAAQKRINRRLTAWARDLVAHILEPLRRDIAAGLSAAGRGLVYQLERGLGTVWRHAAEAQVRALDARDRALLRQLDVRIGCRLVYLHSTLGAHAVRRRLAVSSAQLPRDVTWGEPRAGAPSMDVNAGMSPELYALAGYVVFGPRAIRSDMVERLHHALAACARKRGAFTPPPDLASWLGCKKQLVPEIVVAFGYRTLDDGRFMSLRPRRRGRGRPELVREGGSD